MHMLRIVFLVLCAATPLSLAYLSKRPAGLQTNGMMVTMNVSSAACIHNCFPRVLGLLAGANERQPPFDVILL